MSRRFPDRSQESTADENFLQRWSRLKHAARESEEPGAAAGDLGVERAVPAAASASGQPSEPASPVEKPALPDLDHLDQDSDYSAFLAPEVDAALRRKALRKLFHSPKFNVCDGLDDYCDDFTRFTPLGRDVVTADMRHRLERAASKLAEQLEEPASAGSAVVATEIEPRTQDDAEPSKVQGTSEDDDRRPA